MRIKTLIASSMITLLCSASQGTAGLSPEEQYEQFKRNAQKSYTDFRDKANQEYASFIESAWKSYTLDAPVPQPKREEVSPFVTVEDSVPTAAACFPASSVTVAVAPAPKPQPLPLSVIEPFVWSDQDTVRFNYYGTPLAVRFGDKQRFKLPNLDPKTIAEAWRVMSNIRYNNTIQDCLDIRKNLGLNDWAYLQMLQNFTNTAYGDSDEARLLTAFLFTQSGYKTRIVKTLDTPTPTISMFYGSEYVIYNKPAIKSGGTYFYPLRNYFGKVEYVDYPFPKEQALSLELSTEPKFTKVASEKRHLTSRRYPHINADVTVNYNLIRFFDDYPVFNDGANFMTKWAYYANTPLDKAITDQLYPTLRRQIDTEDKALGVNQLLNLVYTSMPYGYDEKIWGYDRAFFSEESLYYPESDCEDHAILFSRLVRDLLDLDVLLVYYPGHLASAVDLGETYPGDGVRVDGKRYTICDPILPYRAGVSHPHVDKSQMQVIKLNRN